MYRGNGWKIGGALLLSMCGFATEVPRGLSSDARIQQVVFNPNNVVEVQGSPLVSTQILFDDEEVIREVQNGDASAWVSSINPDLPNMLFLKPSIAESSTNMTVVTNEHTYYFSLKTQANPNGLGPLAYAIHFVYPKQVPETMGAQLQATPLSRAVMLAALDPSRFNWDYSFNGDSNLLPMRVFDDGKLTYFEFKPNQPTPAFFKVDNPQGRESLVNAKLQSPYWIVESVSPQWTLRMGTAHIASVFNNKAVVAIRRGASS